MSNPFKGGPGSGPRPGSGTRVGNGGVRISTPGRRIGVSPRELYPHGRNADGSPKPAPAGTHNDPKPAPKK